MKIAANLFAAGQETTGRLLGTMLQILGERPDLQQRLARPDRSLIPAFVEESLRLEPPIKGTFRLSPDPHRGQRHRDPRGQRRHGAPGQAANRDPKGIRAAR